MRGAFLSLALRFRRFSLAWSCHGSLGLLRSGVRLGVLCPLFIALCLFVSPRVACAETTGEVVTTFVREWYPHVIWSEDYSVEGNIDDYRHALIMADTRQDAALLLLGKGPSGVNNDVRKFLSDSTYSPHFAELVDALDLMSDLGDYPSWVPSTVRMLWTDPQYTYYGTFDTYDIKQAYKEYLAALKYAEDGTYPETSGSGDGTVAVSYTMKLTPYASINSWWVWGGSTKITYANAPSTATINFNESSRAALQSLLDDGYDVLIYEPFHNSSSTGYNRLVFIAIKHGCTLVTENNLVSFVNRTGSSLRYTNATGSRSTSFSDGELVYNVTFSSRNQTLSFPNGSSYRLGWDTPNTGTRSFGCYYLVLYSDGTSSGDPVVSPPSGTWSEPDPTPKWGVDIDWYGEEGDTSDGDTSVSLSGTTVYNSENNTYITNNNIDVSSIVQRLDVLNMIVAQIGIDLRTVDDDIVGGFAALRFRLDSVLAWMRSDNQLLSRILVKMDELDKSTNDLVDLSGVSSAISGLSHDIDALISSVTGSHGADALGLYGRLDTVLNWLDDYVPVDVSGIEQALEDWPDYPTFDDSGLLNAITGSHGSDLLGLFGRLDNVLSWLDDYVSPDLSTLNHQLGDLLDADGQTPTVHGLIYSVNGYVEDIDGLLSDVLALGTVTVNGTTYGFTDLLYNTWLDLSRLVGMSTVTAGENTYSFADLLYNVWVDFGRLCDWLVEWWADLFARLDDIIDAIEDLPHNGSNPWHTSPVVDPSDPQGGPIIGPIETDPYGYPKMPDWQTYKEPLNIPALEHAVDELMTKFPFSMLNTIIQVAMFIERPAVAPQFDIPAPNPSDWSQPYLVHVDLSDYDTVAATLRLGIVIWAIVKISNRTINMWVGDKGGD